MSRSEQYENSVEFRRFQIKKRCCGEEMRIFPSWFHAYPKLCISEENRACMCLYVGFVYIYICM